MEQILANTERARRQQIAREQALLRKLEAIAKLDIARFIRRLGKRASIHYTAYGTLPPLDSYVSEMEAILQKHYIKTIDAQNTMMAQKKQEDEEEIEDATANILASMYLYALAKAPVRAKLIIGTTAKNLQAIVRSVLTDPDRIPSAVGRVGIIPISDRALKQQVAREIVRRTNASSLGRASLIAETELGEVFERQKLVQVQTFSSRGIIEPVTYKTWNAVLDSKTRITHVRADGQKRRSEEPFMIGNSFMMYPRDDSMGAPIEETVNCRCTVTYSSDR